MSPATKRFRELATELEPKDKEVMRMKMAMMELAGEISLEMLTDAFPETEILKTRVVSEIKPSDCGQRAQDAIKLMQEHRITPTLIIYDTVRHIVFACIEPPAKLPPAAKPTPRKKNTQKRHATP